MVGRVYIGVTLVHHEEKEVVVDFHVLVLCL